MLNIITLMGRLTKDPELRETQSGAHVVSCTVAVDRNFTNQDGSRDTDFIPVVAWKYTADFIAKHFAKGEMIAITGRLQSRRYEDKTGASRTAFEVVADEVFFCGRKESGKTDIQRGDYEELETNSDLPF